MNERITLPDLISLFCEKQGMKNKKDAELFVRSVFDLIEEVLATEKYVKVKGLGTFKLTEVDSRESVDINTGERIEIQGHTKVSFTPDTIMKDLINKPFAHFETVVLNDGVELEDTPVETPEALESPEETAPTVETPISEEVPVQEETPVQETPEPMVEEPVQEEVVPETVVVEEPEVTVEPQPEITEEKVAPVEEVPAMEETPIEVVPSEEPQPEVVETPKKEKNITRILWGIIVVLVLIILFGAYWMFLRPADTPEVTPAPPVQEEAAVTQVEDTTRQVIAEPKAPTSISRLELTPEELRKERVPALADTLDYLINGSEPICEHTLKSGESIIRISVKYYGSKRFWPYIAKFNSDAIKDPDNIPIGTIIKIPAIVPKE